ncbi:hypothetical protein FRX31_021349 [Thalictrum thalictroides]|uniref:Uncharacterized protein n=1 Tax=Thalictrum thalictroides TaxID=46969 RepID=A0A7J6VVE0_THATH|nr:hypothetical protein FRX31_021349 [Thalictrum thalictroides]
MISNLDLKCSDMLRRSGLLSAVLLALINTPPFTNISSAAIVSKNSAPNFSSNCFSGCLGKKIIPAQP